jgi:hypothetical protein
VTEDEITKVLTPLIVAFSFSDELSNTYDERLKGLSDFEAALRTTNTLIDEVETLRAPPWAVFKKQYDRHHVRLEEYRKEQVLALGQGQGRLNMVTPREGRQIAAAAYAREFRRSPPGELFALPDPDVVPLATREEVDAALAAISSGYEHDGLVFSRFDDVAAAFDGHLRTARAACRSLELDRRIVWRPDGVIVLLPAA